MKSTNNMMLTNFKNSLKLTKFFGLISILIIGMGVLLILASCKGGGAATKPTTKPVAKPKEDKTIKVDKSNPIQMYCIRNRTKIRNFNKTYTNWASDLKTERGFTNYAKIGKLSKYENITVYEIRGNWAYIKTIGDVKGWAPVKFLKKWDVNKFFKGKDNIFSVKSTKELYNDAVFGKVYAKINKGDTIRVLWGNGKRFFVVSKSGKSGWLSAEAVDSSKLIAKNVEIGKIEQMKTPISTKYPNIFNSDLFKYIPQYPEFSFAGVSFYGKDNMLDANLSKYLLVAKQIGPVLYTNTFGQIEAKKNTILVQNGEEVLLEEKIGIADENKPFMPLLVGDTFVPEVVIDGKSYYRWRIKEINFLGMIGIFEVYRRKEFQDYELERFNFEEDFHKNYKEYLETTHKKIVENGWKNKIKIILYTKDTKVKKIKELWVEGYFDIRLGISSRYETCYEVLRRKKGISADGKGGLNLYFTMLENLMTTFFQNGIYDYQEKKFIPKEKVLNIHITKKELNNVGWTADDVIFEWDKYVDNLGWNKKIYVSNNLATNYFSELSISVDGERYYNYFNKSLSSKIKFYMPIGYKYFGGIHYYFCYFIDKSLKKDGVIMLYINEKGEILKIDIMREIIDGQILGVVNSGIVLRLTDRASKYYIKIISGVNYEY